MVVNYSIKAKSSQGFSEAGDGAELEDPWLPCSDYRLLVLSETFLPCNILLKTPGALWFFGCGDRLAEKGIADVK